MLEAEKEALYHGEQVGLLPETQIAKSPGQRISQYRRKHGFLATSKRVARQVVSLPRLLANRRKDPHVHRFRSVEELTDLLFMFKVTRTREAEVGGRRLFYLECHKEEQHYS